MVFATMSVGVIDEKSDGLEEKTFKSWARLTKVFSCSQEPLNQLPHSFHLKHLGTISKMFTSS